MEFKDFQGPGFTMQLPTDWYISSSAQFQAIFLAPRGDGDAQANLTVTIKNLEEGATLLEVIQAVRDAQANEYTNFEILDEVDFTEQGGSGFRQLYSWHNQQNDKTVVQLQAFFLVQGYLFTLTGTSDSDEQETFIPIFNQMIDSFRISLKLES